MSVWKHGRVTLNPPELKGAPTVEPETLFSTPDQASDDAVMFDEPWEAQIFALVVASHEAGVFTWAEWSAALSAQDKIGYRGWTVALEQLLTTHDVVQANQVTQLADAWQRAAEATPHGHAIRLENDPRSKNGQS